MAGTELFMAASPGLFRMMSSLASDKAEKAGLVAGTNYGKNVADARKTAVETQMLEEEAARKRSGLNLHLAGKYGVDPRLVGAMATGQDYSGFSGGVAPEVMRNIQRDLGAGQIGFEKVHPYHTAVAELPGKEAGSTAATMALEAVRSGKATPDQLNMLGNVRTGAQISQPNDVQLYNFMQGLTGDKQAELTRMLQTTHPPQMPYAALGDGGVMNRGTGRVVVEPPKKTDQPPKSIGELVARKAWEKQQGGQAPAAAPQKAITSPDGKWRLKPGANPDLKSSWEPNQ